MTTEMKPMLAGTLKDVTKLKFPVLASPKLDGVRALVKDGVVLSRNFKPIPNQRVQRLFSKFEGLDGELIVGRATADDCFNVTTSGVMSRDGEPDVRFHVFDLTVSMGDAGYDDRYAALRAMSQKLWSRECGYLCLVPHVLIRDEEELLVYEQQRLADGYEGVMLRSLTGPYKYGRSTEREGYLLKLKRFEDGEAVILNYEELMHNGNEQQLDELGRHKRSSHKAGKFGLGTLGALEVEDLKTKVRFHIGSGFSSLQRELMWKRRGDLLGVIVKYKHFPVGAVEKPRFPVFLGIRDARDL